MSHFRPLSLSLALGFCFCLAPAALVPTALAHDYWADGKKVPDWVKASCCGPADAHHLRPDQVHRESDEYYRVDGYMHPVLAKAVLPSQDGDYWIFYREDADGSQSQVYCFFVPMEF